MFHVEPEAVSSGTAPSDPDAPTGCLIEELRRSATALAFVDPDAHSPSGFRWNCAGAPGPALQNSDVWTDWMFHVEPAASVWSDDASSSDARSG
jgi:hypothetical protein